MDKLVQALYELTKKQFHQLDSATQENLEEFVDAREGMIQQIRDFIDQNPGTNKSVYKARIDELLVYDDEILKKMESIQANTQAQIQKTSNAKKQIHAYEPSHYSPDGVFFDSKR